MGATLPEGVAVVIKAGLHAVSRWAGTGHAPISAPRAELTIPADHDRLAQILINLVDNAVKYTPENGWVTVRARALDDGRVELMVRDTGVGIPRADLPRITERFYRVDKARSRELGGTGLGLAIVKHLVMAHGGELAIESEQGEGTTVRVALPGGGTTVASQMPLPIPGV